jgi:cation-transporting ATPase E
MQPEETDPQGADLSNSLPPGLSAAEVAARSTRGEVNRPPHSEWAEYGEIIVRNVVTAFNALVVPAAVALFWLDDYRAAWSVSALALINTVIALVQELRAKRHLERLALLTEPRARVRRDGIEQVIAAGDVVLGDCLLLGPGEAVVADGVTRVAHFLEIDEALLTGESDPVPRRPGDRLLSGSFCVAGEGAYEAMQVGAESLVHQTTLAARRYQAVLSPMQRILDTLIRVLTAVALVLCAVYLVLYQVRGFPSKDLWSMIAATVTSLIPQGLVLMTTLTFTLAAVRMSLRGAAVQRLSAIETMASVDILCLDKTGTLTTGQLSLGQLRPLDASEELARARLQLFAWSSIDRHSKTIQALRASLGPLPAGTAPQPLDQIPFKSQNRHSAVHIRAGDEDVILVLGAFDVLQPLLMPGTAAVAEAAWRELLPQGLRLLLFAEAEPIQADGERRQDETGFILHPSSFLLGRALRPVALVALADELRPAAAKVLAELAGQDIQLKIISGDHPETVRATVARLLGSDHNEPTISGPELESAPDPARCILDHRIFGRVTPRQKLDIIRTLQTRQHEVAMIGDGVNDVLSLKRADLGIAMGAGSSAAKTVAGLVLEQNDFALLPAVLDEGRAILDSLRRSAKLFLLKNVYTLVLILIAFALLGMAFPYQPQQVTLLNALTIAGPAFLIMLDRRAEPMRAGIRSVFLREVGIFALTAGLALGLAGLVVWLGAARWAELDVDTQRTLLLSTLILAGLGNVLLLAGRDLRIRWWAALALVLYAILMYLPWTADFFVLAPLSLVQWFGAVVAAGAAVAWSSLCLAEPRTQRSGVSGGTH